MYVSRLLEETDERDTGADECHPGEPSGTDVLRLEADPAEVVDDERRQCLAGDDEGDERRRAQPRSRHDRRGDVERAEGAADPDPPGRVTDAAPRGQRLEDESSRDE